MEEKIKILIVDDMVTYRKFLSDIFASIGDVEVVGVAANGKIALSMVEHLKPDLITLDMNMPVMDGLETLTLISERHPGICTVMISSADEHCADQTVEALSLGCMDFIVKPKGEDPVKKMQEEFKRFLRAYRIKQGLQPVTKHNATAVRPGLTGRGCSVAVKKPYSVDVILIGASTGGPKALETIIPKLPDDFTVPILIAQHMPPFFTTSLARSLDEKSRLTVKEGVDGETVKAGHVYLAPGGRHMTVVKDYNGDRIIKIDDGPAENSCRPSVNKLFRSASRAYLPKRSLCIVLTGMGSDGTEGVRTLRDEGGGYCLIQSSESSVVYGMPGSIASSGLENEILTLDEIASRITGICMH